jgi:hypothetical protein
METTFMKKNDDPLWQTVYDMVPVAVLIFAIIIMFILKKIFLG